MQVLFYYSDALDAYNTHVRYESKETKLWESSPTGDDILFVRIADIDKLPCSPDRLEYLAMLVENIDEESMVISGMITKSCPLQELRKHHIELVPTGQFDDRGRYVADVVGLDEAINFLQRTPLS
ncbi:hypothetical protein IJH29_00920 [Candidatus Saccharibacteria bacterium]|nr:hypothetical protein [Candidatus Saccharibacteria bacterium]